MKKDDPAAWGHTLAHEEKVRDIAICGVGESDHTRASGRNAVEIGAQAVERALADAGIEPEDVDGLMCARGIGPQFDVDAFHAHFGTKHDIWLSHEGGGMAWAATAPSAAARAHLEEDDARSAAADGRRRTMAGGAAA